MTTDSTTFIGFGRQALAVHAPPDLARTIATGFALAPAQPDSEISEVWIETAGLDRFRLRSTTGAEDGLLRGEVLGRLIAMLADRATAANRGVPLRAAAVGWGNKAILIAGGQGAGKSALAAWFVAKGFSYLADDFTVVLDDEQRLAGLPVPLGLAADALDSLSDLPRLTDALSLRWGDRVLLGPAADWRPTETEPRCGLILSPRYQQGIDIEATALTAAQTAERLRGCSRRSERPEDSAGLMRFVESIPALAIDYGGYPAIDGVLDHLARFVTESALDGGAVRRLITGFGNRPPLPPNRSFAIPKADRPPLARPLTVGMATYDDYDGVYFTVQALRLYHPEVQDRIEILVVDNHPDGPAAAALKALEGHIPNYRYVPQPGKSGTAIAKNRVFESAGGAFVLCVDSHVLIAPGALGRLLDYCAADPTTNDLLQGPLLYDDLGKIDTHFAPVWRGGMYGIWAEDPAGVDPDAPAFDIPMQGLGLFACRRDPWPGFNPAFTGFGGEEGYIHEKIRQAGGRTLCLPFLRWTHRFNRPLGTPYRNVWQDRFRNYWIGWRELGLPTDELEAHMRVTIGTEESDKLIRRVNAELAAGPEER